MIQKAVDAAKPGDTVLVTNGVYQTGGTGDTQVRVTKPLALRSVNGPGVTVIDGLKARRCAYLGTNTVLSGFTLTKGNADHGGGVLCEASGVVTNCVITSNVAFVGGGAYGGTLYGCTLPGNTAWYWGGGAYGGTLHNCTVTGNAASGSGGGACDATLHNCILAANLAGNMGGGTGGGALGGTFYNCTVTGNSSWGRAVVGGVSDATLYNCIVSSNECGNYNERCAFSFSCTTPRPAGVGNITNAPLFLDSAGGNFRLQANSPCINAGNNAYITNTTDLDGRPRIVGGTVDFGAYEFQPGISGAFIAWLRQYGLPTDGSVDATDADADGLNNWQEWRCLTDPTNALSVLRLLALEFSGNNVSVRWQSLAGVSYFLERSADLAATPRFMPLATNLPGQSNTTSYTDTNPARLSSLFYRVSVGQ